jgi:hypothetical protein
MAARIADQPFKGEFPMKIFALTASAAMLIAGSAFAQDSRPSPRDETPTAPSFQQGSGHRAGGPAAELNSPTGMGPATTGTVVVPADPQATGTIIPADPQASGGALPAGKGHSAGGPLGEQMRRQGVGQ